MKLGITGGIACGKSSVAKYLQSLCGAELLDADEVCAQLLHKGNDGWLEMREVWGEKFFDEIGEVDRKILRKVIFSDKEIRRKLESILHPLVRNAIHQFSDKRSKKAALLIFEVPLLFEVGWQNDFDHIVTVYTDRCKVIKRLCARDSITTDQALRIVQAQMAIEDKIRISDSVIDNTGAWSNTCLQVCHLRQLLMNKL